MILVKWQGLLDTEGLIYVSKTQGEQIMKALQEGRKTLRLTLPGRKRTKNEKPYYTFIGRDALASLKQYLERDRGPLKPGDPVWVYPTSRTSVTKVGFGLAWSRLLRRAKLIPAQEGKSIRSRYGFNVHNTRDLAISLLNTVGGLNPKCIEFWAGHDIDPLGYNQFYSTQPDYVIQQYELAEPPLNIVSGAHTAEAQQMKTLRDEIEDIRIAVRMLEDASHYKVIGDLQVKE